MFLFAGISESFAFMILGLFVFEDEPSAEEDERVDWNRHSFGHCLSCSHRVCSERRPNKACEARGICAAKHRSDLLRRLDASIVILVHTIKIHTFGGTATIRRSVLFPCRPSSSRGDPGAVALAATYLARSTLPAAASASLRRVKS
jgi:hypothetical protein